MFPSRSPKSSGPPLSWGCSSTGTEFELSPLSRAATSRRNWTPTIRRNRVPSTRPPGASRRRLAPPGGQDSRESPGLLGPPSPGLPPARVLACPWVKAAAGRGAARRSPGQERSPRCPRERRRRRRPCCGAAAAPSRNSSLSSPSRSSGLQTWDFLGKSSAAAQEHQARPRDARPARPLLLLLCPLRPPGARAGRCAGGGPGSGKGAAGPEAEAALHPAPRDHIQSARVQGPG